MKKFIKKILGYGIASAIGTASLLGIIALIGNYVNWVCANNTRFSISVVVGFLVISKLIKKELKKF